MSTRTLHHLTEVFDPHLTNPTVTEIVVNECGWMGVESQGIWSWYQDDRLTFNRLDAIGILAAFDMNLDLAPHAPMVTTILPGGERLHVCRPPATRNDVISLTIRRPSSFRPTLTRLAKSGVFDTIDKKSMKPKSVVLAADKPIVDFDSLLAEELAQAVLDRKNILIAGATGSGKTTLAKALIEVIPLEERLITIEDAPEWNSIPHRNRVALFYTRKGDGGRSSEKMIESSLRMRPDRVLMQELTDGAAFAYLRSVAAGHPGCITTLHARSAEGAFDALRLMVREHDAGKTLPDSDVQALLHMHIDLIVYCKREKNVFSTPEVYRKP
jgi:type IV secretion system protein VirB11